SAAPVPPIFNDQFAMNNLQYPPPPAHRAGEPPAVPGFRRLWTLGFGHWTSLPLVTRPAVVLHIGVQHQQTIGHPTSFSGIGLHSGNRVNMTFLPAPANSGIRFRRVDLADKPKIEARVENVLENNRSTTIAKGNVKVH